jgi:hypothetical protein
MIHPVLDMTFAWGFNFNSAESVHQSNMMMMVFAKEAPCS